MMLVQSEIVTPMTDLRLRKHCPTIHVTVEIDETAAHTKGFD